MIFSWKLHIVPLSDPITFEVLQKKHNNELFLTSKRQKNSIFFFGKHQDV